MIVFINNKDKIGKYEVVFSKDELLELKFKVIDDCSIITHKDYKSDVSPYFTKPINKEYRNLNKQPVGTQDYFEETRTLYHYEYDVYNYPYLVKLIDRLIKGDVSSLYEIYNINLKEEKYISALDDEITKKSEELDKIDNLNIENKRYALNNLSELLKQRELNKNQKPVEDYYLLLQKKLKFNLIDEILLSDAYKVYSFFDQEIDNQITLSSDNIKTSK